MSDMFPGYIVSRLFLSIVAAEINFHFIFYSMIQCSMNLRTKSSS